VSITTRRRNSTWRRVELSCVAINGPLLWPAHRTGTHCREILFTSLHVVVQVAGSVCRKVSHLRGIKIPQFSLFSHIKHLKSTFCARPTAKELHCRIIPVIHYCSRGAKGVPYASGVFLQHLMGCWGPQKLPKFSPMRNACVYTILLDGASDLVARECGVPFGSLSDVPLNCGS